MGTFSIWHWIIVLVILGGMIGLPILAIRRESTEIRLKRLPFLYWSIGLYIGVPAILGFIAGQLNFDESAITGISFLYGILLVYPLFQRIVRRARDAGKGKTIAYLTIIPMVNIVTMLMLIFMGSVEENPAEAMSK